MGFGGVSQSVIFLDFGGVIWGYKHDFSPRVKYLLGHSEGLTKGLTFLYNGHMMRFIQKHGLLDSDFVVPMLSLFLLLTIAETL